MHIDELYGRINSAINWNAFSYTIFKLTSTVLTFVLFEKLSTTQFALWTGINSLVYLILVWADCGMRKTIPTFFPHLQESGRKKFIYALIAAHVGILTIACPLTLWLITRYAHRVDLPMNSGLLFATTILFFGHGIEMLFQTIFHAYLWHRTYNKLLATLQIAYMVIVIIAAFSLSPSIAMVQYIILGKGIASLLCVFISSIMLARRLPAHSKGTTQISPDFIRKFIKHASLMWGATVLKSLTERNITVPFITFCLGPAIGNVFKVAQDAASLLQRLIYRTIGSTDTSLFSYLKGIHHAAENNHIFQAAFTKLASKLAYLAVPLIGLVWFMQCQVDQSNTTSQGFQLFVIVAIALLLELLLTPYERMLEVHNDYFDLAHAYLVYVMGIGIVFAFMAYGYIGLLTFVIGLFSIRLLSMGIMGHAVYRRYKIIYPYKQTVLLLVIVLILGYILHLIASYFCGNALLNFLNILMPFST